MNSEVKETELVKVSGGYKTTFRTAEPTTTPQVDEVYSKGRYGPTMACVVHAVYNENGQDIVEMTKGVLDSEDEYSLNYVFKDLSSYRSHMTLTDFVDNFEYHWM